MGKQCEPAIAFTEWGAALLTTFGWQKEYSQQQIISHLETSNDFERLRLLIASNHARGDVQALVDVVADLFDLIEKISLAEYKRTTRRQRNGISWLTVVLLGLLSLAMVMGGPISVGSATVLLGIMLITAFRQQTSCRRKLSAMEQGFSVRRETFLCEKLTELGYQVAMEE